jgi:hypothetical protein
MQIPQSITEAPSPIDTTDQPIMTAAPSIVQSTASVPQAPRTMALGAVPILQPPWSIA